MPSTYTPSLRLEEQGVGENNNTWGNKLNTTLDLIDKSIAGHILVSLTGGGTTQLSTVNNGEDQSRYRIIEVSGNLISDAIVEVPAVSKEYVVWDSTVRNGFSVSFRLGAAGATTSIPATTTSAFGLSTDGSVWRPISASLATESAAGVLQIATTSQAQAGTSNALAITPLKLQEVTATETRKGVIELATTAEAQAGTDAARALTPATLQTVTATETRKGVARVATTAEARTGTANDLLITPLRLQEVTATETRKGVVEIATQAEVNNGNDTSRAVVPSTLESYVDDRLNTTGELGNVATRTVGTTSGRIPEVTYQEVTINGGDFSGHAFTLKCMKIGRMVTLWTDTFVSHATGNTVVSASGEVPATFRPSSQYQQMVPFGSILETYRVGSNGTLRIEYRSNNDTSTVTRSANTWAICVTFASAS